MLLAGSLVAAMASGQQYSYKVIPTGLPATTIQRPYSITDSGTILVQPYTPNGTSVALLVTGSTVKQTEELNPSDQYLSLNNAGLMAGLGYQGPYVIDDVLYNQTFITVPDPNSTYPAGVNASGLVVGMANTVNGAPYGWTWKSGTFATFTYPGSTGCSLNAVDDAGDVAGTFFRDKLHGEYFAFAIVKGHRIELGVPDCIDPVPAALTADGVVVGTAVAKHPKTHGKEVGFVRRHDGDVVVIDYKPHAPATIQGPTGPAALSANYQTEVFGVNKSGQIVGMFTGTYVSADGTWAETDYIPFIGSPK